MSAIRILLIDDHAMFRSGLSMVIGAGMKNTEVLEAGSVDEAIRGAALKDALAPDLVLLDNQMPGLTGLEAIGLLQRKWPQAPVVMLSAGIAPETVRFALARGVAAYVSKGESAEKIIAVITGVLHTAPEFALTAPPEQVITGMDAAPVNTAAKLTPRQGEVLDLLCKGLSNKAIARHLDLSENTVRWHVQALLKLLNVETRSGASFAARKLGLIG